MKITVLDMDSIGTDLDLSPLKALGECAIYPASTPEEMKQRVQDAQVVILNKVKMTREVISCAPKLKLICVSATGFDNIDLSCCRERGIAACNVPGYSTDSVALVTVATALSLMAHLPVFSQYVKSGAYTASGVPNRLTPGFHDLAGKTWGIIGYGNIGKKVAQVAQAFGCRVLYSRSAPDSASATVEEICRECDIITLHCPLNEGTRHLISSQMLSKMKKSAILVNAARGAVCDEAAVAQAVLEGRIAGFGCDVYSLEPFPADHPYNRIKDLENVCLTPHIAWASFEARTRLLQEMAENIRAFACGQRRNRVD